MLCREHPHRRKTHGFCRIGRKKTLAEAGDSSDAPHGIRRCECRTWGHIATVAYLSARPRGTHVWSATASDVGCGVRCRTRIAAKSARTDVETRQGMPTVVRHGLQDAARDRGSASPAQRIAPPAPRIRRKEGGYRAAEAGWDHPLVPHDQWTCGNGRSLSVRGLLDAAGITPCVHPSCAEVDFEERAWYTDRRPYTRKR